MGHKPEDAKKGQATNAPKKQITKPKKIDMSRVRIGGCKVYVNES